MAASAFIIPVNAFAHQDSDTSAAEQENEPAVEQNDEASAQESTDSNNDSDDSKTAAATSDKSLPDTLNQTKDSREARKEAMRSLANSYPVDSAATQAAIATETTAQPAETVKPRIIPPAAKTSERMPRFEHHGYFRTRLNAFGNYDLNTRGTSPVPVPLESSQRGGNQQENINTKDVDAKLGGDMRFRYEPTIHLSETIRIAGSFDILDNLVLGTTPNKLRTNWGSNEFFSFNGAEPVNGDTFGKNLISVKALYAEADTLLGTFRAGRIPAQWGMGLVYNDGGTFHRDTQIIEGHGWKSLDADSSDAVDRIEYRLRDPFFDILYLGFSWDFVNSGLASYNLQQDSLGHAFDLSDNDDVLQFTLSLFDKPISQQEIDERYKSLFETREWTVDWGLLFSYREQQLAPETDALQTNDGPSATYSLYAKNAKAYAIDLWGRFYVPMPKEVMLRLEAEFVGVFGSVDLDTNAQGKERDITQIGFGLEAEVWWRDLITGMKTGVAWADNMVYSGHPMIEQLDEVPMGSILRFDPNYRVDEIMFHELMGGINNAWYLNLYGEYKFPVQMPQLTTSLGARVDLTTSTALNKDATPGKSLWYGFEADAKLFYDESDRFRFEIGAGVFVPGKAWRHPSKSEYPILPSQSVYEDSTTNSYSPDVAWNVITNLYFMF